MGEEKECYQCSKWQYNEGIEHIYGQGTGLCNEDKQPKGCNRKNCLLFDENKAMEC